jgi:hypothetical protein
MLDLARRGPMLEIGANTRHKALAISANAATRERFCEK